jgi:hypothetical protein
MIHSRLQLHRLQRLLAVRPGSYLWIVLAVALGASAFSFRRGSIFACQPADPDSDSYVAYCGSTGYGDYDYGAFWFDLEPAATRAAADADVLFIGNSRTQFGLSSDRTKDWFASARVTYYLLGFAYNNNYRFTEPLLRKLQPKAHVYVVNLDLFFEPEPTQPARIVMYNASAPARYTRKKLWQETQSSVCAIFTAVCGRDVAFFRSRSTGMWRLNGGRFVSVPASYNKDVDTQVAEMYVASGRRFLEGLPVPPECQILTVVPTVGTPVGTAQTIASGLNRTLIAPQPDALQTFDGSHLDPPSAERWSQAFLAEAAPHIARCLAEPTSSALAATADVTANDPE